MRKLLIAEPSDTLASALENALQEQWSLYVCSDGYSTIDTLKYLTPDAMILNLRLPQKDGLAVLEECFPVLPPVILALTDYQSPYLMQTATSLGVGYIMMVPCQVSQIKARLGDMLSASQTPPNVLERHLKALRINTGYSGYRCLMAAIPAFKEDPDQLLGKEIYPRVAQECGLSDGRCVERAIRFATHAAWEQRDNHVWSHYFPQNIDGDVDFPANRDFIKRLAEMI